MLKTKKRKSITLKVSTIDEEVEEDNDNEEDDNLALIIRKFKKYMMGEKYKGMRFTSRKESQKKEVLSNKDKKKRDLICHKYKKSGHTKYDFPPYKSEVKKGKKNSIVATWNSEMTSSKKRMKRK